MKTPDEVVADIIRRLTRTWANDLVAADADHAAWPHRFPLGTPAGTALAETFSTLLPWVHSWRDWARERGLELQHATRRVQGTDQQMPTHLVIGDIDIAATVAGGDWPDRLARGRVRAELLASAYPHLERPDRTLSQVIQLSDVDLDLLVRAAAWFRANPSSRLTSRQVPIEGLHAKWLNTRHGLLRDLSGLDDLGLIGAHPARINFTYLDPNHLAAGGRRHDSATVGDVGALAYEPTIVLISENKDTAVHFPSVPSGVAVEGNGRGAEAYATFEWLRGAQTVVYWGDMDADGLEILNEFRAVGIPARSMFMDREAHVTWAKFGTDVDKKGSPLGARPSRHVPHLTSDEMALYADLVSDSWVGVRRVEQERIPLEVARVTLLRLAPSEKSLPDVGGGPVDTASESRDRQ